MKNSSGRPHYEPSHEAEIRELVEMVKQFDQSAFADLLNAFEPLISSLVHHFGETLSTEDREELTGEAALGLYNAALSYDSLQDEVGFGLYAKICIKNRLATACRAYRKRNRIMTVPIDGLDTGEPHIGISDTSVDPTPSDFVIEQERLDRLKYIINSVLSPYESRIWWQHVSGLSAMEIAKKESGVDLPPDAKMIRSVNNALYRIRVKLKASLSKGNDL